MSGSDAMSLKLTKSRHYLITVGAIALACVISANLAVLVLKPGANASPFWTPAGIALAALLLFGRSVWPGAAIGCFLVALSLGHTWQIGVVAAIRSTLGALAGERLIRCLGFHPSLRSLRDVIGFVILGVLLSPTVNATLSNLYDCAMGLSQWHEFGNHWWMMWLGDAMGILVVAPLILTWFSRPLPTNFSLQFFTREWRNTSFRQKTVEVGVWLALLTSASWVVFVCAPQSGIAHYPLEYLPFPFIVWGALRLGQRGTVLSSLLVTAIATWGAAQQGGPFLAKSHGDVQQAVLLLQAFIGVMTITALVLAAAVAERQQIEDQLRHNEASLLNAQRVAQLGNWDLNFPQWHLDVCDGYPASVPYSLRWSDQLYRILGVAPQSFSPSIDAYLERVHSDDRARLKHAIEHAISQREPYHLNYRIVLPDCSDRLVSEQVEISAAGITGTVQDITTQKQAETALRKSEQQFRSMFEGAAIGIGLDDLQGQIADSNPALQAMLGYSREELSQMTFAEYTHPDDLDIDLALFGEMVAGRQDAYQLEKRLIRKNGQEIWVRLTNSLVRDAEGAPSFTIAMIEDVTERKRAEAALQNSEARFRVVAETAACAFLVYQGNQFRYVNPATEIITEYSREELLTMPFWELAHPEFRDIVRYRGLARQQGEAVPARYEIKLLTKSGKERWVDFTAGVIEFEGRPAGMATAYDITDRKHAEAQLRLAADRERLLAEIALRIRSSLNLEEILNTTVAEVRQFLKADRVFIVHFDSTGCSHTVAESVDPQWPSTLGWSIDSHAVHELRGIFESCEHRVRVINDTSQMDKTPLMNEVCQRYQVKAAAKVHLMLNGHVFGVLVANQCSDPREWQPFEIDLLEQLATQVEIAIQQGQLYRQVQTLAVDLEQQVEERTAELQQRMQELQSLNQVKDLLLHAVAHDLRTPVQGMLMVLNRLRSRCQEAVPVSSSMLDRMIQSSDHQLQLLNSLLQNHSTREPEVYLNCVPTPLASIVQTALATLEPLFKKNQTAVISQLLADLPPIQGDPALIQRVFEDLLSNAVRHNKPGLSITLNASLMITNPEDRACNSSPQPRRMLYCTIEDTGAGMSQEQCDRLFQLYVRGVDNCHLTGIGLGLHRCRQIITAHGGRIGVSSRPGAGAKFWLTLPVADGSSESVEPEVPDDRCDRRH